jgi:hypothetical protein
MRPLLSRRRFLLVAGAIPLAAPAVARRQNYIDLRDMIGSRTGPHTAIVAEAMALSRDRGTKVVAKAGTYVLDDDLTVDWDGLEFEGEGEGTRFVQTTPMKGFLQLRGGGSSIRGFGLSCDFERRRDPGRWRGYGNFQRVCAVWAEGGRNLIEAISGDNTFGVVCLRGPVVLQPAAGSGDESNFDYTKRVVGNHVVDISGSNTDFVLTGNQQEDLLIDGVSARNTSYKSVPPHAIYMQNPGSTLAFCGYSLRVRARRLSSDGNAYADAFKFSDIRDLTIESAEARNTAGGLMISTSDGVVVKGGVWAGRGAGSEFTAVRVSQSTRVRLLGGQSIHGGAGVTVYNGSESVDVDGFRVVDEIAAGKSGAPYRVMDSSEAFFLDCKRERRGADRPMFVVGGTATATIMNPECRGSSQLVHCSSGATANLQFNADLIDGWNPAKSLLGAKDRIRTNIGSLPERRITRALPGATDNACP